MSDYAYAGERRPFTTDGLQQLSRRAAGRAVTATERKLAESLLAGIKNTE